MNLHRHSGFVLAGLVIGAVILTACQKAEPDPTPTLHEESRQTAEALLIRSDSDPTATPLPPTPDQASQQTAQANTPSPGPEIEVDLDQLEIELNRSIARMEQAVLARDMDGYMAYVWDGDPTFLTEQLRWAQDWMDHPLETFRLRIYNIQAESSTTATARMTIIWGQQDRSAPGSAGGATITAVYYKEGDTWLFGGEQWHMLETPGGEIQLFYPSDDIIDDEGQARAVIAYLPDVYSRVTEEFAFVPENTAQIKMYHEYETLQTMTRLSIPLLFRWNEPGEAIKIRLGPSNTPPTDTDVAHEYTQFVLHEIAGGTHGNFPWWLEEGIGEYGASLLRTRSQRNRVIRQSAENMTSRENTGDLVNWAEFKTEPDLLDDEIRILVNHAYTFVYYVTDTYGAEARNAWIQAIATEQGLDDACQTHLGLSLEELDTQWRAWLVTQR